MISFDRKASWLPILMAVGCGPMILPGDSDSDPTTDTSTSTEAPPPPSTSTTTSTPTSTSTSTTSTDTSTATGEATFSDPDSTDDGVIFLLRPDGGGSCFCCTVFNQDCPMGEKCVPWSNDGGDEWNSRRCSPIVDDPVGLGEPCTMESSVASGFDNCDEGLFCWDVDPDTLQGTCVAMCLGHELDPQCPAGTDCLIRNNGNVIPCLPPCDPLAIDACSEGDACVPSYAGFVCAPSAGPVGAPCEPAWLPGECGPGSVCAYLGSVPDCGGVLPGCCASTCDLSQPDPCVGMGLVCTSWWGDDPVPPGFEDVGFCALP